MFLQLLEAQVAGELAGKLAERLSTLVLDEADLMLTMQCDEDLRIIAPQVCKHKNPFTPSLAMFAVAGYQGFQPYIKRKILKHAYSKKVKICKS